MDWKLPRPDLRKRMLRRLRRDHGGPVRRAATRVLEPLVGGRRVQGAPGEVVLVLFSTHARDGHFWGNMQVSLLAGEMSRLGVHNEIVVLLMRPGDEVRNRETVDEFLELMERRRPATVVFWAVWLPWLPDRVREVSGARVMSLDPAQPGDLPEALRGMNPHGSVLAAAAGAVTEREAARVLEPADPIAKFAPSFDYRVLGNDEPVHQRLAFVSLLSCPFGAPMDDNPLFAGLELGPEVSRRGCSYCNAARDYEPLSDDEKRRQLAHQLAYLQSSLPELEEIAVPFPEDYLGPLADVLERHGEHGIRPIALSGQFNSDSLGQYEGELDRLLTVAAARGFSFHVNVVGLESFDEGDLRRYNRGGVEHVQRALDVLRRLRERHDPSSFMPRTVGSLILFHPWQTLEGLRRNLDAMLAADLGSLFWRVNVNDVRFHPGVALYHLAERDGLLGDPSDASVQDVPLGGYFTEYPWIFRHRSTARVHQLFTHLQNRTNERVALLDGCVRLLELRPDTDLTAHDLEASLDRLSALSTGEPIPAERPVRLVALAGASNVGYPRDLFAGMPRANTAAELERRVGEGEGDLAQARVTLTGAEPTLRSDLFERIRQVRELGPHEVEVMTYGRQLVYPRYVARLLATRARVSVLLHHADAEVHDRAVRVPGAFQQTIGGLHQLSVLRRRIREGGGHVPQAGLAVVVGPENAGHLEAFVPLARRLAVAELQFLLPLANLELDRIDPVIREVRTTLDAARAAGLTAGIRREFGPGWVPDPRDPPP